MPRQPVLTHREKARIVLKVLAGESTLAAAASVVGVSAQAVANWRRQFIEAGARGLEARSREQVEQSLGEVRIRQMRREIDELKIALAEAHLLLAARGVHPYRGHLRRSLPGVTAQDAG